MLYQDTDASSGQQFYLCETTDNWVVQSGPGAFGATIDDTELTSEDFGDWSSDGTEDGCTLDDDVIAAAEMANADHGDVSWSSGIATVEDIQCTDCVAAVDIVDSTTNNSKNAWWENPVATDDFQSVLCNDTGATWTFIKMSCESDQTVTADVQVDDGTPADVVGSDLTCDSTPATACAAGCDTTIAGDSELANGECVDFAIASVGSSPTWWRWTFTIQVKD
jgi:hypothetical protein